MSKQQSKQITRILTLLLWSTFLLCNLTLFGFSALQAGILALLAILFLFVCELALLLRYARLVGQWRSILVFWVIYALARIAATVLSVSGIDAAVTFAMLVAIYAMLAGWFAMVVLAIRRDVSVAYLVIAFAAGPVLLRGQILASGGVLAWLIGQNSGAELPPFNPLEPAIMAISCMLMLALLTFVPHFLVLLWREWRGVQGVSSPAPAMADGAPQVSSPAGPQP